MMFAGRSKQQLENTRRTLNRGQESETDVILPHMRVLWPSKDDSTVHRKRQKKKRYIEEGVARQNQRHRVDMTKQRQNT